MDDIGCKIVPSNSILNGIRQLVYDEIKSLCSPFFHPLIY